MAAYKDSSEADGNFYLSKIKLAIIAFLQKEEIGVEIFLNWLPLGSLSSLSLPIAIPYYHH